MGNRMGNRMRNRMGHLFPKVFKISGSGAAPPAQTPRLQWSRWSLGCLRKTHHSRAGATFLKIGPMPVDKIALQTARMREWCQFVSKI